MERLLKAGFDEGSDWPPLHVAALKDDVDLARYLLDKRGCPVDAAACGGHTALHCAGASCSYRMMRLLLERGAQKERCNDCGYTAIQLAVEPHVPAPEDLVLTRVVASGAEFQVWRAESAILCDCALELLGDASDDITGYLLWERSATALGAHCFDVLQEQARNRSGPHPTVLELGAGTGAVGICCAFTGASVILTDGSEPVLELLERNVALNAAKVSDTAALKSQRLKWGDRGDIARLKKGQPDGFPMIMGTELIYSAFAMPFLFGTVDALLAPDGVFVAAYRNDVPSPRTLAAAYAAADEYGFSCTEVESDSIGEDYKARVTILQFVRALNELD